MEHVLGRAPRVEGCLFEPPGATPFDRDHLLLFRDELCVVLLNRFPYANGHLLLAPRRHVADPEQLTDRENLALMRMVGQCCAILRRHLRPHGINVGLNLGAAAGAGIADHLHFHLVPRWRGTTISSPCAPRSAPFPNISTAPSTGSNPTSRP